MYLEDEAREFSLTWLDHTSLGSSVAWRWSDGDEALQELANTEVVDRRAKEYGSELTLEVCLALEAVVDTLNKVYILAELLGELITDILLNLA